VIIDNCKGPGKSGILDFNNFRYSTLQFRCHAREAYLMIRKKLGILAFTRSSLLIAWHRVVVTRVPRTRTRPQHRYSIISNQLVDLCHLLSCQTMCDSC